MKQRVFIIFLFQWLMIGLWCQNKPLLPELSFNQDFILPANAERNDIAGKFYAFYDYKIHSALSFVITGGNINNAFSIDNQTGIISVNNPGFSESVFKLTIITNDGLFSEIDTATIRIVETANCLFIDPSRSINGNGSRGNPYNSWESVRSYLPGRIYLQKRGTVYNRDIHITGTNGTSMNRIAIGAYGQGSRPIVGENMGDAPRLGIWLGRNYSPVSYLDIFSFVVHSSCGITVENNCNNIRIYDCETYNCRDNAGIYLKFIESIENREIKRFHEVYNCISHDNGSCHGIKAAPGTSIINCYVFNNADANGISSFDNCEVKHCLSIHNGHYGIKANGENILIRHCLTQNNYIGINVSKSNNTNLSYNFCEDNNYGIEVDYNSVNTKVENCSLENNLFGISVLGRSQRVILARNSIKGSAEAGIRIASNPNEPGLNADFSIQYNVIYDNAKGMIISNVTGIDIFNNTLFNNYLSINDEVSDIEIFNNILGGVEGNYSGESNIMMPIESLFLDAPSGDFHLKPFENEAIDAGRNHNTSFDYDGNLVPFGTKPDIGAFEYYPGNDADTNGHYIVKLNYWSDNSPLIYDAANPELHLKTKILLSETADCEPVFTDSIYPDLNGNIQIARPEIKSLVITRDQIPMDELQNVINGMDAHLAMMTMLGDKSFVPSACQMIAMDVNMDGIISAGDFTQINQRSVLKLGEFKQAWNYNNQGINTMNVPSWDWIFVNAARLDADPEFMVSSTYPLNDGRGYFKLNVPPVEVCHSFSDPDMKEGKVNFFGIMLGDIDGNYNSPIGPVKLKSTMNAENVVIFDLAGAERTEKTLDIPVYINSDVGVKALDFQLKFNTGKLLFDTVVNHTGYMEPTYFYNTSDSTLRFTSYSMLHYELNKVLVTLRFLITGENIETDDFYGLKSWINGENAAYYVTRYTPLGFPEQAVIPEFKVYPNPARLFLHLESTAYANVNVLDMFGQTVMGNIELLPCIKKEIATTGLLNGWYLLKFTTGQHCVTRKVLIDN